MGSQVIYLNENYSTAAALTAKSGLIRIKKLRADAD